MVKYLEVETFHPWLNSAYMDAIKEIEDSDQPYIVLVVDSYGGYVDCLTSIIDTIDTCSKPTVTIGTGVMMSCGGVLSTSGTPGLRFVSPSSRFMIHQVSGWGMGKSSDIEAESREMTRLTDSLVYERFDKQAGKPLGYTKNLVKENFNADLFLTAQDCIEHNFMDAIMSRNQVLSNIDEIYQNWLRKKNDYNKQIFTM